MWEYLAIAGTAVAVIGGVAALVIGGVFFFAVLSWINSGSH